MKLYFGAVKNILLNHKGVVPRVGNKLLILCRTAVVVSASLSAYKEEGERSINSTASAL
jgi:hypothetical protein